MRTDKEVLDSKLLSCAKENEMPTWLQQVPDELDCVLHDSDRQGVVRRVLALSESPTFYCGSLKASCTVSLKNSALASKLLARTRSLLLQLCSLKNGLKARSKATTLVLKETKRTARVLSGNDLQDIHRSEVRAGAGVGAESSFFAALVNLRKAAASAFFCFLYEMSQVGRPVGCCSNPSLPSQFFLPALVHSFEERTALRMCLGKSLNKARKAAMTMETRFCTRWRDYSQFLAAFALKEKSTLSSRPTNTSSLTTWNFDASPQSSQNTKSLYQLLRTGDPREDRKLIPGRDNALNALPDMSIFVAKQDKTQNWESRKASTLDITSLFST